MTAEIENDQFWRAVSASELLLPHDVDSIRASVDPPGESSQQSAKSIAGQLVQQKRLTSYQAKILLAGHSGPFRFGGYEILKQVESHVFTARHRKTGFGVWLHFFPGANPSDLDRWDAIESKTDELSRFRHAAVIPVYESFVTPDYRFIVTGRPAGKVLAEKVPDGKRIPAKAAAQITAPIADGIAALHGHGIVTGPIDASKVWIQPDATTQFLPELFADVDVPSSAPDFKPVAALFCRLAFGKDVSKIGAAATERLQKLKLPDSLINCLAASLPKLTSPDVQTVVSPLADELKNFSDHDVTSKYVSGDAEREYQKSIASWLDRKPATAIAEVPDIELVNRNGLSESVASGDSSDPRTAAARVAAMKRKQSRWGMPAAIAGSLALFSLLIGGGAFLASRRAIDTVAVAPEPGPIDSPDVDPVEVPLDDSPVETETNDDQNKVRRRPLITQTIDDDETLLWESPTTGPVLQLPPLPSAPQIVVAVAMKKLAAFPEGEQLIGSPGPDFGSRLDELEQQTGFPSSAMRRMTVSLHSDAQFVYERYVVVELAEPMTIATCLQNWGEPQTVDVDGVTLYEGGSLAYWVIPSSESASDESTVTRFAMGPRELVEQVATGNAIPVGGTINRLAALADDDRDFNLFFLNRSLVNDEGRDLLGGWAYRIVPELRLLIDDSIRGGLLSLHIDNGNYVELTLDQSSDVAAEQLSELTREKLGSQLRNIASTVQQFSSQPFWSAVQSRYGAMIETVVTRWRWDVEFGTVKANVWLPPHAIENLIAASELALSLGRPGVDADAPADAVPQSLEELLATRRSLKITNPPDLNVLLSDIRSEVQDQYLKLPFAFNIRIGGADLQKEGITQNQRPGELDITDQTLADILTQVMVSANPNRDISGASDPQCKLVWVVTDDPESPGQDAVLITTRAAAAAKGYELPQAFVATAE